jgi:hypothetical protein
MSNYRVTLSASVATPEAAAEAVARLAADLRGAIAGLPAEGTLNVSVWPEDDEEAVTEPPQLAAAIADARQATP